MNTCRLHGSPKASSGSTTPMHHSRNQNIDGIDDISVSLKENRAKSPASTTPIIEHKLMTPCRQQTHHQLHINNDLSSNGGCKANNKNKLLCSAACGAVGGATSSTAGGAHHQPKHSHSTNKVKGDSPVLRHRWQACPELHKAMDGVNYIADHTKKEEESTKVKFFNFWS